MLFSPNSTEKGEKKKEKKKEKGKSKKIKFFLTKQHIKKAEREEEIKRKGEKIEFF